MAVLAALVTVGYLAWRVTTVDAASVASVLFFLLELHGAISLFAFIFTSWGGDSRTRPEPATSTDASLAVIIPTYNEPADILLPTVAAAVAIEPAHETWVLDDGKREWVREMAEELGARYLDRPNNDHAKAGNINHALDIIDADIVGVLDADHVPTPGFLTDMVGYFDDPEVVLVQSPQDFYNTDSFEHIGDDDGTTWSEESLFYRAIQPAKNRWNSAFWCGTSALVRTDALRVIGGVATSSVTEDMLTTMHFHQNGWKTVFHNEVLARGLAPANYREYILQRRRWAAGSVQVLRSRSNPLFAPGLSITQRLSYLSSILGWFDGLRTLGFLAVSLLVVATGVSPVQAPWQVFLPAQLATVGIGLAALAALGRGRFKLWPSMVFEYLRLPASLDVAYQLIFGYRSGFKVTPKGKSGDDRSRGRIPSALKLAIGFAVGGVAMAGARLAGVWPGTGNGPAWGSIPTEVALFDRLPGYVMVATVALVVQALVAWRAAQRIRSTDFADDRREARRFDSLFLADFGLAGSDTRHVGELIEVSAGGGLLAPLTPEAAADLVAVGSMKVLSASGVIEVDIEPLAMAERGIPVRFAAGQWSARAALMRELFDHTPTGSAPTIDDGVFGGTDTGTNTVTDTDGSTLPMVA